MTEDDRRNLGELLAAAGEACDVLREVTKAVHIDWPDDVYSSPGYGKDALVRLYAAVQAFRGWRFEQAP